MRKTLLVLNRHAWRSHRAQATLDAQQGLQLFTIEQLAARLAGGFLQGIDPDDLNIAVAAVLDRPLGELDAIKALPGFRRAAVATLAKAWTAGLDLGVERNAASGAAAKARLDAMGALEREVLERLPKNQLRPCDLVAAALGRVPLTRTLFGRIEIRAHTEMAPVWRPLLSATARATDVLWIAEVSYVPDWVPVVGGIRQLVGVSSERLGLQA